MIFYILTPQFRSTGVVVLYFTLDSVEHLVHLRLPIFCKHKHLFIVIPRVNVFEAGG